MLQVRCTKKVLDALGLKQADLSGIKEPDSTLGNWYAHLFTVDRRKTLIFMNERSLLSFIVYGMRKDNIANFKEYFYRSLRQLLLIENIGNEKIEEILAQYETVEFTRTDSRTVLGNLNDLVDTYQYLILYNGGLKECDLTSIIRQMNRTPQRNLGWNYSVETMAELLKINRH
ncbi:MAG: hypothetical protein HY266_07535 [Deltaproteobacteria bacterium]|nr:hypothetical protein [Deltaproteobacteria bacterium]